MPRLLLFTLLAACGSGGGFPDARAIDAAPPKGAFSLAWTVTDTNGVAVTCDQLGASSVTVITHNLAQEGANTQVFVCSLLTGTSEPIDPGTYQMSIELDGTSQIALPVVTGTGNPGLQNPVVIDSEQTTALEPVTFSVVATGNIALTLATGRTGGNCAAAPNGGGITATEITMTRNSDLSCAPLTLSIAAGATKPAAMYTINCTAPTDGPCIESDQSITAANVSADQYTMHVKAKQTTPVCWSNNDSIVVPPLGGTLTRQLNLGFATTTTGCM
jgi:hypothetical protein